MAIAEVFTFPAGGTNAGPTAPELLSMFGALADQVEALTPTAGLAVCAQVKQRLDAVETAFLARVITNDNGDDRRARRMARQRGASNHQNRKRAARAKAVSTNPALRNRLEDGSLSTEELDLLAGAASKSDDDALFDNDLITRVGTAGPDQGKRIVRNWLQDRHDRTSVEETYQWQHKMRSARRWDTNDGLAAITVEGDDATIDTIWNHITADANRLYQTNGGRDISTTSHPRTHHQRLHDAFTNHWNSVANKQTEPNTNAKNDTTRIKKRSKSGRPTVVITVSLDKLTGHTPSESATQIGTGPIADALLAKYLAHSDLIGLLFGQDGQPLWLGRTRRHATAAQHLALTIRDKGCVLCSTPAHLCQVHHRIPWHAPSQGTTDIDQLVLVCGPCHQYIHQEKLTIEWNTKAQVWTTRPATPNELPPTWAGQPQRE